MAHPSPQPKWHLNWFGRFCTDDRRVSLYFTMGRPFPPSNCRFPCGIWTPSNIWFPVPTRVLNPNGISVCSAVFAGLTSVTDRLTYHTTESVIVGRICIYVVLRCGLKMVTAISKVGTEQSPADIGRPFYWPLSRWAISNFFSSCSCEWETLGIMALFYKPDALSVAQQTVSGHWRKSRKWLLNGCCCSYELISFQVFAACYVHCRNMT